MRRTKLASALIAGAAFFSLSAAANADIVNINATTNGVNFVTAPGVYKIEFIGVADGGAFNAWNSNCPAGDCTSGWVNTFAATDAPLTAGNSADLFAFGTMSSSALGSLAAVQGAPAIPHGEFTLGVPMSFHLLAPIAQPWIQFLDGSPAWLFIPDADGNLSNNYGGVSLRFTPYVAAIPEPTTWALAIIGFAMTGFALRRRRAAAAIA